MSYNEKIKAIAMPSRIAALPVSDQGFPVPWFVAVMPDGSRDIRVACSEKKMRAVKFGNCWVCGDIVGRFKAFVIGPMCAINRVTSEPPTHRDCAEYAIKACPFLVNPRMRRRDAPEGTKEPEGIHLERNPGVSCLWITREFSPFKTGNGFLIRLGEPIERPAFYAQGRQATGEEVAHSVETGLPFLKEAAEQEGPQAIYALMNQMQQAAKFFPPPCGSAI